MGAPSQKLGQPIDWLPPVPAPFAVGERIRFVGPRRFICGDRLVQPGAVGVVVRVNPGVGIAVYSEGDKRQPCFGTSIVRFDGGEVALVQADQAHRFHVIRARNRQPQMQMTLPWVS